MGFRIGFFEVGHVDWCARQETITLTGGGPEEVTRSEWARSLVGASVWVGDFLGALHCAAVGVRKAPVE